MVSSQKDGLEKWNAIQTTTDDHNNNVNSIKEILKLLQLYKYCTYQVYMHMNEKISRILYVVMIIFEPFLVDRRKKREKIVFNKNPIKNKKTTSLSLSIFHNIFNIIAKTHYYSE